MYLWTQKAEDDFRARHPRAREKDILRRAGEPATYDGQPLKVGEIANAFKMRGWIVMQKKEKAKKKKQQTNKYAQLSWLEWQRRFKEEEQIVLGA